MLQRRRSRLALAAALVALLLVGRALLPKVVRHQVNRRLDAVEGYGGWIGHVDLALWRGAYALRGVEIFRDDGAVPVPLFAADRVDFTLGWRALARGELHGEVTMRAPIVHFVDDEDPEDRQTGAGRAWTQVLADLYPFAIDRLRVIGGEVHFHRFDVDPPVDVHFESVNLVALGLTNREELAGGRGASVAATAMAMGHAGFQLRADFEPVGEGRRFDLDAELYGLELVAVEDLLRAYAPVDVESGQLDLMVELAGEGGQVLGYVQPIFRDLVVFDWESDVERDGDGPLRVAWEALVGASGRLLENQEEGQLAARVPIEGALEAPDADVLELVASLLRNAFVEALKPRLAGTVGAR